MISVEGFTAFLVLGYLSSVLVAVLLIRWLVAEVRQGHYR